MGYGSWAEKSLSMGYDVVISLFRLDANFVGKIHNFCVDETLPPPPLIIGTFFYQNDP